MLADRQDQSPVAMGNTAAGKTSNIKLVFTELSFQDFAVPNRQIFTGFLNNNFGKEEKWNQYSRFHI